MGQKRLLSYLVSFFYYCAVHSFLEKLRLEVVRFDDILPQRDFYEF